MMPCDSNMTSMVQRIARQALLTFRHAPRLGEEAGRSFLDNHSKLHSLMTEVRAADLQLIPRRAAAVGAGADSTPAVPAAPLPPPPPLPPVTYMHICETDHFSMGVFLLKSGASIPLHDHPGMHGVLKVMYGQVRISCFDRLQGPQHGALQGAQHGAPQGPQYGALRPSILRSSAVYTEHSEPCVLSPDRDNLHQIDAVDGPTAFMDILAPPYDPDDGRDCHYYRVLREAAAVVAAEGQQQQQQEQQVWLMEISQPPEFWCGSEPYPGPEVNL